MKSISPPPASVPINESEPHVIVRLQRAPRRSERKPRSFDARAMGVGIARSKG
jgi:hypothetical protein